MLPARPIDADAWVWRRVVARGRFTDKYTILLDNRIRAGRAGFEVVTPLAIEDGDSFVLVNRGWIAQGRTRSEPPTVRTPAGPVQIDGIAMAPLAEVFELGDPAATGRVWQHLNLDRYRAWSGLAVQPIVVLQTSESGDELLRRWPPPESGAAKHSAYAWQWYIFALLTAILYVALNLKRARAG